jgi:hypothetical protein
LKHQSSFSRRALSRIEPSEELWVCWRCNGRDDISRVLNLSVDGLFIHSTHAGVHAGLTAKLDFLVQEGSLRVDAAIRHVQRGSGVGLKFTAFTGEDRTRFKALLARLRSLGSRSTPKPPSHSALSDG